MGQAIENSDQNGGPMIWVMAVMIFVLAMILNTCGAQSLDSYKKIVEMDKPRLFYFSFPYIKPKKEWPFNILGIKARITIRRKLKFHGNGN